MLEPSPFINTCVDCHKELASTNGRFFTFEGELCEECFNKRNAKVLADREDYEAFEKEHTTTYTCLSCNKQFPREWIHLMSGCMYCTRCYDSLQERKMAQLEKLVAEQQEQIRRLKNWVEN